MATGKNSFVLYTDLIHTVEKMPDDKAGLLLKHILAYVNDLNPETDDLIVQLTFEPIKQQLKRDLKKWESELSEKSEGGQWGNLKRWHKDIYLRAKKDNLSLTDAMRLVSESIPSDTDTIQSLPIASIAVSVNDSVSVSDNVSVNKRKKSEDFSNPVVLSEFEQTLKSFFEMRVKIKKPATERAKELILSELDKLAGSDESLKIQILNQSIRNCWQDVYPLKDQKSANTGKTPLTEDIGKMDYSKTTF